MWDSKEMGQAGSSVGQQEYGPGLLQCGTARIWAGLALVWDNKEMGGWLQCGTTRIWAGLALVWDSKNMGRAGSSVGQQGDGPGWL